MEVLITILGAMQIAILFSVGRSCGYRGTADTFKFLWGKDE